MQPQTIAEDLPSTSNRFVDRDRKRDGEACNYQISVVMTDGRSAGSVIAEITWYDRPIPPSPRDLRARWRTIADRAFVELTWAAKAEDDHFTQGYIVYSDDARHGILDRKAELPHIAGNEYLINLDNSEAREVTFELSAVDLLHRT